MSLPLPSTRDAFGALNSVVRPAVRAGVGNPLPLGGGAVILETTGRVSGQVRQVPVLAVRQGNKVSVSTVRDDSQWLANIAAEPAVAVWMAGRRRPGTAHITRGCLNVIEIELQSGDDTGTQS